MALRQADGIAVPDDFVELEAAANKCAAAVQDILLREAVTPALMGKIGATISKPLLTLADRGGRFGHLHLSRVQPSNIDAFSRTSHQTRNPRWVPSDRDEHAIRLDHLARLDAAEANRRENQRVWEFNNERTVGLEDADAAAMRAGFERERKRYETTRAKLENRNG